MPFVAPAIAAIGGTLAAGGIGAAALQIGASVALSALARAVASKPDAPKEPGISVQYRVGEDQPLAIVLGRAAVGGSLLAPAYSSGVNFSGDPPNKALTRVHQLSDTPITSVDALWLNGRRITFGSFYSDRRGNSTTVEPFAGKLWLSVFPGDQITASADMLTNYGGASKRRWQADMIGRDIAYATVMYKYDRDLWSDPQPVFEVLGAPLYDPRQDTTAGGSGTQRWDDPTTWVFSENPVVQIYNILRGIEIVGVGVWGLRVDASDLPYSQWAAAMDVCDEAVPLDGGGTEPRYRAGLEVTLDREPLDVIGQLLKACAGDVVEVGGTWHVTAGPPPPPVLWITDDPDVSSPYASIITTEGRSFEPFPSLAETYNGVAATYPSPEAAWQPQAAEPYYRAELEAEDGGRRLVADVQFGAVSYERQVRRLMREMAEDHRRMRTHVLTLPPSALHVMPLDTISFTGNEGTYADKLFEVRSKTFDPISLTSRVLIRERDPADYNPDAILDAVLPDPPDATPEDATIVGVAGFAAAPWTLTDGTNNRRPGIRITWDAEANSSENVLGLEFEIRSTVTGVVVVSFGTQNVAAGEFIAYQGLLPDHQYEVRARTVAQGRPVAWSGWALVTTPDVKIATYDIDVDNFSAAGLAVFGGDLRSDGYSFANKTGWVINSNGTANFFGKVTVEWLVANAVTTEKINFNAVHDYQAVVSTASSSVSLVFTGLSSAYDLLIMGEVEINSGNPGTTHEGYGEIFVNGTRVGPRSYGLSSDRSTITVIRTRAAANGTNTITFDGGGASIDADVNSLSALVLMR